MGIKKARNMSSIIRCPAGLTNSLVVLALQSYKIVLNHAKKINRNVIFLLKNLQINEMFIIFVMSKGKEV